MTQYDIIIIGGGMVGASLACALRDTALRIALVDAAPLNTTDDPRLIALNYSSYCLFNNIHVWDLMAPHAEAIKQVHVSDRGHLGMTRLNASDVGLAALGYVVPAKYINAALDKTLNQNSTERITILRPAKLKTLSQASGVATLTIEAADDEIQLTAKRVIGADGTHSTVREQLNITNEITDYQQSALVTVTTLNRPHQQIAYERFHQSGAIAMLPLTEQRCATIWTDEKNVITALQQLDDGAFLAELQQQFGYRAGRLLCVGKRHVFPLQMVKTSQTHKERVLLIGNAAHTLHPIAAQGLNLALAEIAMLAQVIVDNPTLTDWQPYLDWQQQQETASSGLSHQLPQLFANDFSLVNFIRQLGLIGLDLIPPLKRRFAWRAMGRSHNTPRLLLKNHSL
jgi:2-octaprenyl-6-methoxyphenol hydroxylase